MIKSTLISVIIPTVNEEQNILRTVKRVREAAKREKRGTIEIIIADGGSSDNTVSIIKKYAKVVLTEQGRGIQMNKAAQHAKGDILVFLHADTLLPLQAFKRITKAIKKGAIGGAFRVKFDRQDGFFKIIQLRSNFRSRFFKVFFGDQALFVTKTAFYKLRGFKNVPIMEDVDFSRRMKSIGKVILVKDSIVTSARKFVNKGMVYTYASMGVLMILFHLRMRHSIIKRVHDLLLR